MYSSSSLASSCRGCCCCSYSVRPNVTDSLRSCLSLYGWIVTSRVKLVSGDKINKWRMCGGEFYEYLFWLSLPLVRLSFFSSFCLSLSFTSSTSVTFSFFLPCSSSGQGFVVFSSFTLLLSSSVPSSFLFFLFLWSFLLFLLFLFYPFHFVSSQHDSLPLQYW